MNKCKRSMNIYQALKFIDNPLKPFTYNKEERNWLKYILNYSWRNANISSPRFLRPGLGKDRTIFKEFLSN